MSAAWPPSPFVEDEAAALANEHLLDTPVEQLKSDDQPAGNRGTVNQYPIILDSDQESAKKPAEPKESSQRQKAFVGSHSSDESSGPATPPPINKDRRFVHISSQSSKEPPSNDEQATSRSKSRSRRKEEDERRGRPHVSRIQTDVGSDLSEMLTGKRRAPSPYAYKAGQVAAEKIQPVRRFSGEQLLSPKPGQGFRGIGEGQLKRAASAKPHPKEDLDSSSTDSDQRRRHHSRRRSTKKSFSRGDLPRRDEQATAFEKRPLRTSTESGLLSKGLHESARPLFMEPPSPHSRRTSKDSPYNSSAEETKTRHRSDHLGRSEKRLSRESPLNSSDEARTRHHHDHKGEGRHSRRGSLHVKQRPRLEPTSQHHSYGGLDSPVDKHDHSRHRYDPKHHSVFDGRTHLEPITPTSSSRTPEAIEDAWEKAFKENQAKASEHPGRTSVNGSPYTSPPQTPPRTPRVDRRSKDFYESASPVVQTAAQWSRPSGLEQGHLKDVKPISGVVAGAAAASMAASIKPTLSRSSTTSSLEMTSSGSLSKPSSGHRSRKPSPVYEEPRTFSRSASYASKDDRAIPRPSVVPPAEDRSLPRSGLNVHPADHPGLPQRAASYNAAIQQPGPRPTSSPRHSSTLLPSATLTEAMSGTTQPRVRSTPSSAERSITTTPEPATVLVPPPCPRSIPRSGYADWYTIKGIPELDICPSCIGTLRNSRFRDHFIPSMPKSRQQEVKCGMSMPWIRIAWVQVAKQNRPTLEMMWKLTHLPSVTRPCPGKKFETRPWYRLIDPSTGRPVPNFEVCSACVHAVDNVFPLLTGALERTDPLAEELDCNLNPESRRFSGYIIELDKAHARCRGELFRKSDIQPLADYTRRVSRVRECHRDMPLLASAWHFLPEFPDFTICEECFEDVVRPHVDKPIARDVHRTKKVVPTTRPGHFVYGRTCQLYSDRMRKLFLDAVKHNDLELLTIPALKRLDAEQLLQEKQALYVRDMKAGIDRKAEMERHSQIWKTWE